MKMISCFSRIFSSPLFRFAGMAVLLLLATANRSLATTDYLYYSGSIYDITDAYYRYDVVGNTWEYDENLDGGWVSSDPAGACLVGGDNFAVSGSYAEDTYTGQWYYYGGNTGVPGGDAWVSWENPGGMTDFTYGADENGAYEYDNIGSYWYYSLGVGEDWIAWDNGEGNNTGAGRYSLQNIIGGQNWTYSMVGGNNYAYDSVIDTWYIDDEYQVVGQEVWSVTSDPN